MSTTIADVAVLIVTYNSRDHVTGLLDSLPAALGDLTCSVVVVDNGSSDGTPELLATRADCLLVRSNNDGYAAGINRGLSASAPSDAVLVLNPDTVLDAGAVPAMLAVLTRPRAGRRVGIVAPRVREADGSLSPTLRRRPTLARVGGLSFTGAAAFAERVEDPEAYRHEHEVDWAVGAILMIDRACFEELGGLDESYFLYSEETDFCLRAADAGWRTIYTPVAGAMHVGGGSGESVTTHTMKAINRVRLYQRRVGGLRAWAYFALTVLIETRRAVRWRGDSWPTVQALVRPSLRPAQLGASDHLLPR